MFAAENAEVHRERKGFPLGISMPSAAKTAV